MLSTDVFTRAFLLVVEAQKDSLFGPHPWFTRLQPGFPRDRRGSDLHRNLLSDRFFGDIEGSREAAAPVAPEDWRAFWIGLIGVVFVVLSLREIAYMGAHSIIRAVQVPGATESRAFEVWPPRIRLGMQLVLGLFLVLGAPGLVGAWTSLRSAGRVRE